MALNMAKLSSYVSSIISNAYRDRGVISSLEEHFYEITDSNFIYIPQAFIRKNSSESLTRTFFAKNKDNIFFRYGCNVAYNNILSHFSDFVEETHFSSLPDRSLDKDLLGDSSRITITNGNCCYDSGGYKLYNMKLSTGKGEFPANFNVLRINVNSLCLLAKLDISNIKKLIYKLLNFVWHSVDDTNNDESEKVTSYKNEILKYVVSESLCLGNFFHKFPQEAILAKHNPNLFIGWMISRGFIKGDTKDIYEELISKQHNYRRVNIILPFINIKRFNYFKIMDKDISEIAELIRNKPGFVVSDPAIDDLEG